MPRVPGARPRLQTLALLVAGALVVHDLRVVVGYGHDAELVMREPAHAYLPLMTAIAAVLLAGATLQFTRNVVRAASGVPVTARSSSFRAGWTRTSGALVAVYLVQAGAESFFDPGHPIL